MDSGLGTLIGARVDASLVGETELDLQPYAILKNDPNPFHENLFISFKLMTASEISLAVYDLTGREIVILVDKEQYAIGKYVKNLDPIELGLTQGIYMIMLFCEKGVLTRKVIFVN